MLRDHLLDENEKLTFAQMAEDARQLRSHALATQWFQHHKQGNETLFGTHYAGTDTDWSSLANLLAIVECLNNLVRDVGHAPCLQAAVTVSGIPQEGLERLADLRATITRSAERHRAHPRVGRSAHRRVR